MTVRRMIGAGLLLGAIVVGVSGCVGPFGVPSGDDRARAAVEATAKGIAEAIDDGRPRNVLASEFAYRYSDEGSAAPRMEQTTGSTFRQIEALAWNGMTRDDDGAQFVLRISVQVQAHDASFVGEGSYPAGESSACYGFRVFAFFEWRPTTADRVDCPADPAQPPPSPAPPPALPADAHPRLEAVLAGATEQSLAADLEAAFPDDSAGADPVTGAQLIRDSGAERGVLAAAVGIAGTTDCAVGVRKLDGTVRTWHPQDITLAAGEMGCTIGNALHPVTTH